MDDIMDRLERFERTDGLFRGRSDADWMRKCLCDARAEIEKLRDAYNDDLISRAEYELVIADHRRLTRELDVALNGEAGAAKQASLCDVVGQVKDQRWKLVRETL